MDNEFGPVDLTDVKPDKLPRLIDVPGFKELIEAAYRAGFRDGAGCGENNTYQLKLYEENSVHNYIKALGVKENGKGKNQESNKGEGIL